MRSGPASTEPAIVRVGSVPSTQGVAFELAEQGAPDRTVVCADHQSAGRGRHGRRWQDEPGASLLVSILLRPRLAADRLPTLSHVAGIAVVEALAAVAALATRLKWPNDVLVGGRKIAGILLETRLRALTGRDGAPGASNRPPSALAGHASPATSEATRSSNRPPSALPDLAALAPTVQAAPAPTIHTAPATTILGIGVNVAQTEFPGELAGRATSIALETGRTVDRDGLLAALLERLDAWRARLEGEGFAPVRERWLALGDTIGRQVTADGLTGLAVDLDHDGALIVETPHGRRRVVAGPLED